jgi:hypothetical protein
MKSIHHTTYSRSSSRVESLSSRALLASSVALKRSFKGEVESFIQGANFQLQPDDSVKKLLSGKCSKITVMGSTPS